MGSGFEIVVDMRRCVVRVTLEGFLDLRHVVAATRRQQAALASLRCPPNAHLTIVDVTGCKIQRQPVALALAALIGGPRYRARRTAFVTGGSPAAMQVRRLIGGAADMRLFADPVLAEAWLLTARAVAA